MDRQAEADRESRNQKRAELRAGRWSATHRRQEYLRLRSRGMTYDEIAAQVGVNPSTVRRVVTRYLDKLAHESERHAAQLVELEIVRLDELEGLLRPKALAGHLGAVDRLLKVAERRAKLLGIEAPRRHRHEVVTLGDEFDAEEVQRMTDAWINSGGPVVDAEVVDEPRALTP